MYVADEGLQVRTGWVQQDVFAQERSYRTHEDSTQLTKTSTRLDQNADKHNGQFMQQPKRRQVNVLPLPSPNLPVLYSLIR